MLSLRSMLKCALNIIRHATHKCAWSVMGKKLTVRSWLLTVSSVKNQRRRWLDLIWCRFVEQIRHHNRANIVRHIASIVGMCGKPKFGSDSVLKNRTVTEPSKNLTSVHTVFRQKLRANSQFMLKVTKSYFTCIQMCT